MSYVLTFFMDLKESAQLLQGRMTLIKDGELVDVYIATSGSVGNQDKDETNLRAKGAIPSCLNAGIKSYWVSTKGLFMPDKPGIKGMFYPILPFTVTVAGVQRGDFGIHADENVPGSAGCIVLPPKGNGWKVFQERMRSLNKENITRVPLVVVYS